MFIFVVVVVVGLNGYCVRPEFARFETREDAALTVRDVLIKKWECDYFSE